MRHNTSSGQTPVTHDVDLPAVHMARGGHELIDCGEFTQSLAAGGRMQEGDHAITPGGSVLVTLVGGQIG